MAAPRYRKISAIDNRVTFVTCRARAAVTRSHLAGSYRGTASISQQRSAPALENQQRWLRPRGSETPSLCRRPLLEIGALLEFPPNITNVTRLPLAEILL
jgi:hypothetical protein